MSRRWTYAFALALFALVMVWLYGTIDYLGEFAHVDLRHYRVMAQAAPGFADVPQPFLFRPLAPYLAGLLPAPDPAAFYLLSAGALIVLVVLLYDLMQRQGRPPEVAAFTAVLLALNPYAFGFFAFNFFQLADVLAMLSILVAFHALGERRWWLLALTLSLGVLAREPAVLVAPVAFVLLWERGTLRSEGLALALAVLPGLLLFVGLRLIAEPTGGPSLVQTFINASGKAARPETWYRLLVNAWAPLSLLPLVFFRTTAAFVREHRYLAAFAALVLLSAFFGGDQERLVAPALIVAYPLFAALIEHHLWTTRARIVLALAAVATSLHHLTARFPLPSRTWTIALSLAALAAVTVVAMAERSAERARSISAAER